MAKVPEMDDLRFTYCTTLAELAKAMNVAVEELPVWATAKPEGSLYWLHALYDGRSTCVPFEPRLRSEAYWSHVEAEAKRTALEALRDHVAAVG